MRMSRPISRPPAILPVGAMKTYRIAQPATTHTRPASCAEVGCLDHQRGWTSRVPAGSELVDMILSLARGGGPGGHRYGFVEVESGTPGERAFLFAPGQPCFRADTHRVTLERPPLWIVRGGDWRGSTGLIRRHHNGAEWVEDFAEHQDRIAHRIGGRP